MLDWVRKMKGLDHGCLTLDRYEKGGVGQFDNIMDVLDKAQLNRLVFTG